MIGPVGTPRVRGRALGIAVAACLALAVWAVGLCDSASAAVTHRQEGTFAVAGFSWLSVDNSGGPSAGDLYIGEINLVSFATRVYQTNESGTPTGVELDGSETPAGSFGLVDTATVQIASGPAVDSSSGTRAGDIYVPDIAHDVIDLFDEAGHYVCQITGSATPSASECAGATGSQTPRGTIEPLALTVDPANGDVIVGDASGVLYRFNEAGEFEAEVADSHITAPKSLAVDSTGSIWVVNGSGEALKFSAAGSFEFALGTSRVSVGVDTNDDHVYLGGEEGPIEEFDSAGNPVSTFGVTEGVPGARSIGVNETTDQVFLTPPFGEEGQIWSKGILVPAVTTGAATGVGEGGATVAGAVDPEIGEGGTAIESCRFEYVDDATFQASEWGSAQSAQCSPPTPYSAPTSVSAQLSGLSPSTIYHYRLVAVNALGAEGRGEGRTFNTFGPPLIETEISIARTRSATVKARINPSGSDTTCEVEYVDAARFEAGGYAGATKIPCPEALPAGFSGRTASVELTGLTIGTAYHYRFVAHNGATTNAGTTVGADQVFSTFGIESFSVETLDREGNPFTQAGGHPYLLKVIIAMTTTATVGTPPPEQVGNLESVSANLRSVRVSLPPGVIGNPMAAPKCDPFLIKPQDCAASTQIGNAFVRSARGTSEEGPVYNLVPPEGVAAQLGTRFNNVGVARIDARVRTGSDYGIDADTLSITADEGVKRVEMSIWGVPADEGHFGERFCPEVGIPGCGSDAPLRPFLANPTSCSGPSAATLSVDSWQEPGSFVSASAPMSAMIRCDRLDFSPTIRIQPETKVADSPTGLHVDLHVPQNENPTGLAEANLRDAVVTLPRGLVINPAGANGLEGCSPGQIELHGPRPARCPDASKIGSVEVDTPLLDHPIEGAVYVAQQGNAGPAHGANPFGSLLAIYIAVDDPQSGVVVKLAGHVEADPQTGQLTTTFSDNPQLPFEHFKLNFFGGPRAALSTPTTCGSYAGAARLTPWSAPEGAAASLADSFQIGAAPAGGPCAGSEAQLGNTPNLEAGTVSPVAGAFSPFVLKLSRPDGSQRLAAIEVTLPKGLVGRLKGIPYCSEAAIQQAQARDQPGDGSLEQAAPSCPAASQVGSVDARAGVGTSPISVAGKAYLGGPYKGAPLSLVIVTPAVAGPFDLGNVVVRSALRVNPETAQITAVSDPLPTILHGIPLDLRSVTVSVDREDFTLNPTNCDPMKVSSAISGTGGGVAHPSSRFQVGSCERLGFKPNLALSLKGGTTRAKNPALKAVLTAPAGQANIRKVQVILPKSVFIDNRHINGPCTRVEFAAGAGNGTECPAKSILGKATAWSPLLEKPLTGKVYFRSNGGERKLPDLVVSLDGQIHVNLVGFIDSVRQKGSQISRTRNTFALVPDAPVSKFVLELQGGKKGLLQNSTNLCKSTNKATVKMDGQNGKVHDFETVVKPRCGHGGRSKK